ncbi:hypothetical protein C2845_PM17G10240 [Panicum miliaceum]|uniref:Uncharacterized protein n=1 Tax=Panicum miliaceum TaxID=4540 RepID=A0A3L6PZM8_PANMI|nr:hypothetical protein C2845_PM17G10240 [Panicum miliaceum]
MASDCSVEQFMMFREEVKPITDRINESLRWTRQGQPPGSLWADKVRPFVESWAEALDDVVFEDRPHSDEAFAYYLRWYLPRTRTRVVHVPPQPRMVAAPVSETYPLVLDQNFAIVVLRESEYRQVRGTNDDDDSELAQTDWVNSFFAEGQPQDEVGPSQMPEAPPATQDSTHGEQTPVLVQGRRSTRDTIPPEPLTYSQHQTRAAQAAARCGRRRGKHARI